MSIVEIGQALVSAISAGFGLVSDFVKMVTDSFAGLFLTATTTGEGSSAVTTYQLSTFAIVAFVLMGIGIVTGLGMLIFRKFFNRS